MEENEIRRIVKEELNNIINVSIHEGSVRGIVKDEIDKSKPKKGKGNVIYPVITGFLFLSLMYYIYITFLPLFNHYGY